MSYVFRRSVGEVEKWLGFAPAPFPWPRQMTDDESKAAWDAGDTVGDRPWYVSPPTDEQLEMALRFIDFMANREQSSLFLHTEEAELFKKLHESDGWDRWRYG